MNDVALGPPLGYPPKTGANVTVSLDAMANCTVSLKNGPTPIRISFESEYLAYIGVKVHKTKQSHCQYHQGNNACHNPYPSGGSIYRGNSWTFFDYRGHGLRTIGQGGQNHHSET